MAKKTRTYKVINRSFGKAIDKYDMISPGDRILVGLSGGKDSLTLLWFLKERLNRIIVDYDLSVVYVDPGFEGSCSKNLANFCRKQFGLELHIAVTDYGVLAHSTENRENPCFLCSRLRRKHIFELAAILNCNKVAFGHHKDDMIETLLLNMFYAGQISTMLPSQSYFAGRFHLIRPLILTNENNIQCFANENGFPRFPNPCPSAGSSKRKEIKTLLQTLYAENPKIKGNLFRSMQRVNLGYLPH